MRRKKEGRRLEKNPKRENPQEKAITRNPKKYIYIYIFTTKKKGRGRILE
jgi:hypothetical protein